MTPASANIRLSSQDCSNNTLLASEDDAVSAFVDAWNESAARAAFVSIRKLTAARATKLRARLNDVEWAKNWRPALERMSDSPFCCGQGERGWRADVDWFLKPDSVWKLLEGKYEPPSRGQRASESGRVRSGKYANFAHYEPKP